MEYRISNILHPFSATLDMIPQIQGNLLAHMVLSSASVGVATILSLCDFFNPRASVNTWTSRDANSKVFA